MTSTGTPALATCIMAATAANATRTATVFMVVWILPSVRTRVVLGGKMWLDGFVQQQVCDKLNIHSKV